MWLLMQFCIQMKKKQFIEWIYMYSNIYVMKWLSWKYDMIKHFVIRILIWFARLYIESMSMGIRFIIYFEVKLRINMAYLTQKCLQDSISKYWLQSNASVFMLYCSVLLGLSGLCLLRIKQEISEYQCISESEKQQFIETGVRR